MTATRVNLFLFLTYQNVLSGFSMQEIICKYIKTSAKGNKYAVLASTSGELTWEKPIYSDFQALSRYSS
jgi:hypothetical protein